MSQAQRPLFREHALKHYLQKREKDILPRLVSPPTFICGWFLLCLVVAVGVVAWLEKVPVFVNGSGIVLAQEQGNVFGDGGTARLFLPASQARLVHVGETSLLQVGRTGPSFTTRIVHVEPGLLSPDDVHKRYGFNYYGMPVITEPSVAVDVEVKPSVISRLYAGSPVSAQVQIGTRRVLSLLPGFDSLIGD
jgi:hypothetical protein